MSAGTNGPSQAGRPERQRGRRGRAPSPIAIGRLVAGRIIGPGMRRRKHGRVASEGEEPCQQREAYRPKRMLEFRRLVVGQAAAVNDLPSCRKERFSARPVRYRTLIRSGLRRDSTRSTTSSVRVSVGSAPSCSERRFTGSRKPFRGPTPRRPTAPNRPRSQIARRTCCRRSSRS